jgi:hypothetical protein
MWDGAWAANRAYEEARALVAELEAAGNEEAKARVEALAPAGSGGSRFAASSGTPTLNRVSGAMMSAAMAMQGAEVAPTRRQIAACQEARAQFEEVMRQWAAVRGSVSGG